MHIWLRVVSAKRHTKRSLPPYLKMVMLVSILANLILCFIPLNVVNAQDCTNTPLTRLTVGNQGQVIVQGEGEDGRLRVRENPGLGHAMVAEMVTDEVFSVINGPECVDSYYWWQVTTSLGMVGWSAESVAGTYFVRPLNQPNPDLLPSSADYEFARFSETMEFLTTLPTLSLTHLIWSPDSQTLLRLDPDDCAPVIRDARTDEILVSLDTEICPYYIMWNTTASETSLLIYDALNDTLMVFVLSGDPLAVETKVPLGSIPLLAERHSLLRWLPNGNIYLMLYTGEEDSLWFWWPRRQWNESKVLEPLVQEVHVSFSVDFSPDMTHWVTTVNETDVAIFPVEDVNAQRLFAGHGAAITSSSLSPDGTKLATAAEDNAIFIWDVATQERLLEINIRDFSVAGLRWNHQGTLLASTSLNTPTKISIWDTSTGQLLLTLPASSAQIGISNLLWSPDDRQIMTYTDNIHYHSIHVWKLGELR